MVADVHVLPCADRATLLRCGGEARVGMGAKDDVPSLSPCPAAKPPSRGAARRATPAIETGGKIGAMRPPSSISSSTPPPVPAAAKKRWLADERGMASRASLQL
jgi:hypothetical protein